MYALWRHPDLLPSFPTWPPVAKKLANGADLMLPGVVVDRDLGLKAYNLGGARLQKGDLLQVNLVTNRAALAVGTAALSSEDMYMAGGRGRGVRILHCYGDQGGNSIDVKNLGPKTGANFPLWPLFCIDKTCVQERTVNSFDKGLQWAEEST